MAARSNAYDDVAYRAPQFVSTVSTAGAATASGKWTAFTSMLLKSCTASVTTAGTSTSTAYAIKISAAATATTTIGTLTPLATGVLMKSGNFTLSGTALQGDVIAFLNASDATVVYTCGWESYVLPGADLTA
jgi:hypothetical protein